MNEIKNELILLEKLMKEKDDENKKFQLEWLLDRFENDITTQLKDIEYKKKDLENNLNLLEYIRKELGVK